MATPIGANILTALSRRFIVPRVVDQIYKSNPLFIRLDAANKRSASGGLQIEVPLAFSKWTNVKSYKGFDLLDTTPQDFVKNGAWDWKQKGGTISIDGATLRKNDSPESIQRIVELSWERIRDEMADQLGAGLFSDLSDPLEIDGLRGAVDDGTVAATYAGLSRSTNAFWKAQVDTTTTTLTLSALQALWGKVQEGAQHPTLIVTTQSNYNRYWALLVAQQRYPVAETGSDEVLATGGFTHLLFNNVPFVVDSHCTVAGTFGAPNDGDHLYMLNENYIELMVMQGRDFEMHDFQEPVNQDAYVAKLLWMGNLVITNVARQGKMTKLTA